MRKFLVVFTLIGILFMALTVRSASAATRQIVIVVADGLNPQTIDFGNSYIKKAYEPDEPVAFEQLKAKAKVGAAAANTLSSLRGILKTASANGYKTGIVTTGDVTKVAPLLYDIPADAPDVAQTLVADTKFDFIAGGGRGHFVPQGTPGSVRTDATDLGKVLANKGGTPYFDLESLENESKGKILALQADDELSYSLDRSEETESDFSGLVTQALDALSADDAPFVLVVHDTLLGKALATKDSPAFAEQFHQFDGIISSLLDKREENPADFGVAVLTTGGPISAKFTTDNAQELTGSVFILSNLPLSYSKAGASLKGADEAKITEFSTEQYKGWKLSNADRAAIIAGTLDPEAALRASYEPALKVSFETAQAEPVVYALGIDATGGLEPALRALVGAKPGKATVVADAGL